MLVVEDDFELRDLLRSYLERDGRAVLTTGFGAEALRLARSAHPDLVVLDLGLPDLPGAEVAHELRTDSDVPILMLTGKSTQEDRIRGLESGADDYLSKPFSPREFVLRVAAILRRGRVAPEQAPRTSFGDGELIIDEDRRELLLRGRDVALTPSEWGLLTTMARRPGRVYSRYELLNSVRGDEQGLYERTVDSHLYHLRRKIELDPHRPRIILTVLGGGYRFALARDA